MKKLFLLPIVALLFAFVVGCDNAAQVAEMKAKQAAEVEAQVASQVAEMRKSLVEGCNSQFDAAVRLRYDSLMAVVAKPAVGVAKPTGKPTPKPTGKPAPKPEPVKPPPPPPPAPKPTGPVDRFGRDASGKVPTTPQGATSTTATKTPTDRFGRPMPNAPK